MESLAKVGHTIMVCCIIESFLLYIHKQSLFRSHIIFDKLKNNNYYDVIKF